MLEPVCRNMWFVKDANMRIIEVVLAELENGGWINISCRDEL